MKKNHSYRCAVFGNPIAHSKSPIIHNAFAKAANISMAYDKVCVAPEVFAETVESFFAKEGDGLNITLPFKEVAFSLPNIQASARARTAQAINTLWYQEGQLHGCNTDGIGLVRDLQRLGFVLENQSILIIGAGGATRGIIEPLVSIGKCAHITVTNRTLLKAEQLVRSFTMLDQNGHTPLSFAAIETLEDRYGLIINATSSSLTGEPLPIAPSVLAAANAAYDLFYAKDTTLFLQQAQAANIALRADGLGMLIEQAAESFFLWTGCKPETHSVHHSLRQLLS